MAGGFTHSIEAYKNVIAKYESMNGFRFQHKGTKYKVIFEWHRNGGFSFDVEFRATNPNASAYFPSEETLYAPLLDCDDFELLNAAEKAFDRKNS
jgi:hypothetical protein